MWKLALVPVNYRLKEPELLLDVLLNLILQLQLLVKLVLPGDLSVLLTGIAFFPSALIRGRK